MVSIRFDRLLISFLLPVSYRANRYVLCPFLCTLNEGNGFPGAGSGGVQSNTWSYFSLSPAIASDAKCEHAYFEREIVCSASCFSQTQPSRAALATSAGASAHPQECLTRRRVTRCIKLPNGAPTCVRALMLPDPSRSPGLPHPFWEAMPSSVLACTLVLITARGGGGSRCGTKQGKQDTSLI